MKTIVALLLCVLGLCHIAAAHAVPDVAGVRLGMTAKAAMAALARNGVAATQVSYRPCLRDDLARAAGRTSATGPGHCAQSIDARYAGGALSIRLVEDVPKHPGRSVVAMIAVNYPTDSAAVESLIRRAGQPSLTDGKKPWERALWCFDFACADMADGLADRASGTALHITRESGFTLWDDGQMSSFQAPAFRRPLAADPQRNYGPTPRQAAMHVLLTLNGTPLVFERVNVAGRYATVLSNGEIMPEQADHEPLLFERFAFGWQSLVPVSRCEIDGRGISVRDRERLLRGMPKLTDDQPCEGGRIGDAGPSADIEALRLLRHEQFVPSVRVADNFAQVAWFGGPGGGEAIYRKRGGTWVGIAGGGGAHRAVELRALAVPESALCVFDTPGADCPAKR